MGHTYSCCIHHVVYSTKDRRAWLSTEMMPPLAAVAGAVLREDGGKLLAMNGPADHVHQLAIFSPRHAMSDVMRRLKAGTSKWIHQTYPALSGFAWQEGYAAFSVSQSASADVRAYIAKQADHHRKRSFEDELKAFLERHGIAYDPRYLL